MRVEWTKGEAIVMNQKPDRKYTPVREKMNKGEAALVQIEERKHPHFAQFEIKAY